MPCPHLYHYQHPTKIPSLDEQQELSGTEPINTHISAVICNYLPSSCLHILWNKMNFIMQTYAKLLLLLLLSFFLVWPTCSVHLKVSQRIVSEWAGYDVPINSNTLSAISESSLSSQSFALVLTNRTRSTKRQNTYKYKTMQHNQSGPSEQHKTHSTET